MLRNTKMMKEKYEDIQRKLFYMIPEKWEEIYLYASVIDKYGNVQTGELYFYYIPKGILKRKPVNVYEIPSKFNIEEKSYMQLVENLYKAIKDLRLEFKFTGQKLWSNITISIANFKFKIEYGYEELPIDEKLNYERHIIWRNKYLKSGTEVYNKEERKVLEKYSRQDKEDEIKKEVYETGIYVKGVKNIVVFDKEIRNKKQDIDNETEFESENTNNSINQILKLQK